jgi:hypothetical protein
MPETRVFNESVFTTYANLKKFFNHSNAIQEVLSKKNEPVGAYAVGLPQHQTAFVKVDDELGYFFDPNHGIIEIQGPELAEKLYDRVSTTLLKTGDGADIAHLTFHIDFIPVTLRA